MWMQTTKQRTLQNLTPETILGLENLPFSVKAEALPGVVEAFESFDDVLLAGDNPDEETVDVRSACRITPDSEERMVVLQDHIVVGGLAYDTDAEHCNPLENGSGNGAIYHYSRHGKEEQAKFYEAMGLDGDGNRDLGTDPVLEAFGEIVRERVLANLSLFQKLLQACKAAGLPMKKTSVMQVITDAIDRGGWESGIDYLADSLFSKAYWDRVADDVQSRFEDLSALFCRSVAEEAWERADDRGLLRTLNIPLDIYSHGADHYSISGEGYRCQWDTSSVAAVWVPCSDAIDNIRANALSEMKLGTVKWFGAVGNEDDPAHARYSTDGGVTWVGEGMRWNWRQATDAMLKAVPAIDQAAFQELLATKAREYCRGVLEEWNSWINGDVHGVLVYVIDRHTGERIESEDEECWGFIGGTYAEEELESLVLGTVATLVATKH